MWGNNPKDRWPNLSEAWTAWLKMYFFSFKAGILYSSVE